MKNKLFLILATIVLVASIIACGSSGVVVATPIVVQSGGQEAPTASQTPTIPPIATTAPTSMPGPSPTPEIGFARSRPVPLGNPIIISDETIQVTNVIAPADDLVDSSIYEQFYPRVANQEYVAVEISIACNKTQDETCRGVDFRYSIVGSSGHLNDGTAIQVLNECIECDTVYGGATLKGYVVFIVDKSETNLILVAKKGYDPFVGNTGTTVYLLIKP